MLMVYRSIEDDRQAAGRPDADPSQRPNPFDARLLRRLFDLVPIDPELVDAAITSAGGTSTGVGVCHPRVRGTGAASLREFKRPESPERLAGQPGAIILADARADDSASLAGEIGRWLDARPGVLVLVSGLGRVGECPVIVSLMNLCTPGSGIRFQLLRELGDVLMASRLGLVARSEEPRIDDLLDRLRMSYSGDGRYLDLLRQANELALGEARIDEEVSRDHWTFAPLAAEIEGLKRKAGEADERAAAATRALFEATTFAGRLAKFRRRLSGTPLGGAWRMARRARLALVSRQ
jgi:hypothetical protein